MHRLALGLAALALLPASASADTFCVQKPTCAGMDVPAGLQAALDLAGNHAGPDRIELGPTPTPLSGPFQYVGGGPLELVGAGVGVSRLTQPGVNPGYATVLLLAGQNAAVTVSDLSVELPAGHEGRGLRLGPLATAHDVKVKGVAQTKDAIGVMLDGGTLRDATVDLPDPGIIGVSLDGTGALLEDTGVDAGIAVRADAASGSERIRGATLRSSNRGIDVQIGTVFVEDTTVDLRGSATIGMAAEDGNDNAGVITLDARHVTVVGDDPGAVGVRVANASATESAVVHLKDSVVSGMGRSLVRIASQGSAAIDTDHSAYADPEAFDLTGPGALTETSRVTGAPALDTTTLVPSAGSPLVDAGTPGPLGAGERTTDAAGRPRLVDGSGGCTARRDVGALERQPVTLTAVATAASTAQAGEAVAYSAAGSCDPDPAATVAYDWAFDDGATATGAAAEHAWTTDGTHVATLTVHGGAGRSGVATASVEVTAPAVPTATPGPSATPSGTSTPTPTSTPTAVPDRTPPVLTRLRRRSFTLSEPGEVVLRLRRGHGKVRRLAVAARAGRTTFRLRIRRPGRYRLTARPTDAAGNRGRTVRLRFQIR